MTTIFLYIIYAAFICLGLFKSLLGVAWPSMQIEYQVPYSYLGIISMALSVGTLIASLLIAKLLKRFGTGNLTFVCAVITALSLLGFFAAPSYLWLVFLAVPLGLGSGTVESGFNIYVAKHYKPHHMNWLHSFWGIGALLGPVMMAQFLEHKQSWRKGYLTVSLVVFVLVIVLFLSLPLWKKAADTYVTETKNSKTENGTRKPADRLRNYFEPLKIRGVALAMITFLTYCGLETTVGLWGSSFFIKAKGLDGATAARWVSLFYGSITAGRLISGFISMKISKKIIIRTGALVILSGTLLLLLPLNNTFSLTGFALIGLGCAPIIPCMLHETPVRFGMEQAETIVGFQIVAMFLGSTFLPPLFGFVASILSIRTMPIFILVYIIVFFAASEKLNAMFNVKHATDIKI